MRYTVEDSVDFLSDLVRGNTNEVFHKSAEFIRRKVNRLVYRVAVCEQWLMQVKDAVVGGFYHTVHGLRDFGSDSKWLIKTSTRQTKYSFVSYGQETRARHVKRDVMKMIPFSFFLIIPGMELALPAYLKIFPNSLPSQFESDSDRQKARKARKV